ncbi:hypothetical protein GCM10022393_04760 [Aquimarina addita]|uniref:DUF3667 domain-containing protein n=2 Tax=Aquimarina addita TaxID=870485 RepID=A0ABP7X9V5_9FLAO
MASLLFKPGKISREYIDGKRVKYTNPFRFYLSISIIFFIIFYSTHLIISENERNEPILYNSFENQDTVINYTEKQLDTMSVFGSISKRIKMYSDHYVKTETTSPDIALDSLKHKKNNYTRYLYKRAIKLTDLKDKDGSDQLLKFIFNKLPLSIFFFLPIFALTIWILYVRRPFNYMDHLIFIFHTQTLFFILFGIATIISRLFDAKIFNKIAFILFLIYLFLAMKRFYQQSVGKTIVKFLLVNILFSILAAIGIVLMFSISIFLY